MHYVNPTSNLQPAAFRFLPDASGQSPFTESEEMELAVELLEVTSEAELEQFLGNLLEKAWRGIKPVASGTAAHWAECSRPSSRQHCPSPQLLQKPTQPAVQSPKSSALL